MQSNLLKSDQVGSVREGLGDRERELRYSLGWEDKATRLCPRWSVLPDLEPGRAQRGGIGVSRIRRGHINGEILYIQERVSRSGSYSRRESALRQDGRSCYRL